MSISTRKATETDENNVILVFQQEKTREFRENGVILVFQ